MKKIALISLSAFIAVAFSACTNAGDSLEKDSSPNSDTQTTTQITETSSVTTSEIVTTNDSSSLTDSEYTLDAPMTVYTSSNMELEDEHTVKATDGSFVETFDFELIDGIPTWTVSCTNLTDDVLTINPDLRTGFIDLKTLYENGYSEAAYGVIEVEIQPHETYEYTNYPLYQSNEFGSNEELNDYLKTNNRVISLHFITVYGDGHSNDNSYQIHLLIDPNLDTQTNSN